MHDGYGQDGLYGRCLFKASARVTKIPFWQGNFRCCNQNADSERICVAHESLSFLDLPSGRIAPKMTGGNQSGLPHEILVTYVVDAYEPTHLSRFIAPKLREVAWWCLAAKLHGPAPRGSDEAPISSPVYRASGT